MILKYNLALDKLNGRSEYLELKTWQVFRHPDLWLKLAEELDDYDLYATIEGDISENYDRQGMLVFRKRQNPETLDTILEELIDSDQNRRPNEQEH